MNPPSRVALDVKQIDAHHQEITARLRLLDEALARGDRGEAVSLLAFLRGYVVDHFAAEESALRAASYPGLASHKAEHDRFISDFLALELKFERAGTTAALSAELRDTVAGWLERHIRGPDQLAREFLLAGAVERGSI